ncbi:glyoxylase-like metal-dependent hydrolase (beta-lactamase superfamily II) [Deinococcus sp. HSC-46F16]|uniref:MBL fold metallo-hydrolase n=1 Tax=Deinococcus sp. HSC-46F16 TaxID=2910968 RepID=UPI0020A029CF|nr:MBL fold metallo-hydrolase [Deinococcus sp. HSC-46F16]MCP2012965.1 glyoxylase-like metal-dependent hydrolase (beta-lactamase superfamily II) [Deinococcus sp. HSC-46F16]
MTHAPEPSPDLNRLRPPAPPVSTFGGTQVLRPDVVRVRLPMVNAFLMGLPGEDWVLLDAGMPGTAGLIRKAADEYHAGRPPVAIVLTHGHLDHIGALHDLLKTWPVPVYAHPLELPHLTGRAPYPFPDPTVGGTTSLLSPAFVPGPFDFRPHVRPLPEDGSVPHLPEWRWLHTPGHSSGHVSLWREEDRTLIAGDAFVTTKQESAAGAFALRPTLIHRPPAYYTPNWDEARDSVRRLSALHPWLVVTGHGHPMSGPEMDADLARLARNFDELGRPRRGWYVNHPVPVGVPPVGPDPLRQRVLAGLALGALALILLRRR